MLIDPHNRFSIIIPVYKEQENVNDCLTHLCELRGIENAEVILVDGDGGSSLKAVRRREFPFRLVEVVTERGRGVQLNAGAFSLGVIGAGPLFNTWLAYVNSRKRLCFTPYGDQALFMTPHAYRTVGGFLQVPIIEDVGMTERLNRGRFRVKLLHTKVLTLDRRWKRQGYLINLLKYTASGHARPRRVTRRKPRLLSESAIAAATAVDWRRWLYQDEIELFCF